MTTATHLLPAPAAPPFRWPPVAERRAAVEARLRAEPNRSDRSLARELGVGRELVAGVRRQLTEARQIPGSPTRVGADGKIYPAVPPERAHAGEKRDAKPVAPAVPASASPIDEMLALMTKRVMEVVTWTQAEGFLESYKSASAGARGLFQTSIIKLAARADQLRKPWGVSTP